MHTTSTRSDLPSTEYIIVYILEGNTPEKGETLRNYFNHPSFVTHLVKIDVPEEEYTRYPGVDKEEAGDFYRFRWCLNDAKHRACDSHVLVIKDSSVTHISAYQLANLLIPVCHKNCYSGKNWDLCYLLRWQDRCDLLTDREGQFVRTYSPHGCQAILFSPRGRDTIIGLEGKGTLSDALNSHISQGKLVATAYSPNLFSYDISQGNEYYRSQECQAVAPIIVGEDSSCGWAGWFWLLLILFIILAIWLFCAWCGRRSTQAWF